MAQNSYVLNTETTPCGLHVDNSISLVNENPTMMGTKSENMPLEVQMINDNRVS
jgi:hypothetical protein